MNTQYQYDPYLEHHGIKGQKWGVRRYQNPDGTRIGLRERYEKRRIEKGYAPKDYDYKQSKSYKKLTDKEKKSMDRTYKYDAEHYGKKLATQKQYDINEKGMEKKVATSKMKGSLDRRNAAIGMGLYGAYVVSQLAPIGMAWYAASKAAAGVTSSVVGGYAASKGLNVVKGGFTPGFKSVAAGKEFVKRAVKMGMM